MPFFDLACTTTNSCYRTGAVGGAAVMLAFIIGLLTHRQERFPLWLTFGYKPFSAVEKIRREERAAVPLGSDEFYRLLGLVPPSRGQKTGQQKSPAALRDLKDFAVHQPGEKP